MRSALETRHGKLRLTVAMYVYRMYNSTIVPRTPGRHVLWAPSSVLRLGITCITSTLHIYSPFAPSPGTTFRTPLLGSLPNPFSTGVIGLVVYSKQPRVSHSHPWSPLAVTSSSLPGSLPYSPSVVSQIHLVDVSIRPRPCTLYPPTHQSWTPSRDRWCSCTALLGWLFGSVSFQFPESP